jgi:hypothetical protein
MPYSINSASSASFESTDSDSRNSLTRPLLETQFFYPGDKTPSTINGYKTILPSLSNLITTPINFFRGLYHITQNTHTDQEGFREKLVHLSACIVGLAYSVGSLVSIIDEFTRVSLPYAHLPLHITASFLCFLALLLESFHAVKILLFKNQFESSDNKNQCLKDVVDSDQVKTLVTLIKAKKASWSGIMPPEALSQLDTDLRELEAQLNHPDIIPIDTTLARNLQNRVHAIVQYKNLRIIQKDYFEVSGNEKQLGDAACEKILRGKSHQLVRRVQPYLYRELVEQKDTLLAELEAIIKNESPENYPQSIIQSKELFSKVDKQLFKSLVIHTIAIGILATITTGVILSFIGCPIAPLVLAAIGGSAFIAFSLYKTCVLPKEGWDPCAIHLVPQRFRHYFCCETTIP